MNRLSTWIWKEWHEQRRMFLALLAVVPVGVWALFATLGQRMEADNGRELTWRILQPAVLLLYVLCIATDVFAGERQRGSLSLVQRMPHGLRTAFLVKFVFLLLGAAALLAWTLCVLASGWWIAGNPIEAWRTLESVTDHRSLMLLPAMLALFGWIALVSIWLPRGGAAAGAAPMLLVLLLLPFAWICERWPFFHSLEQALVPVSALVGLTGLAAAWVSWRHGLRFGRSSWRALRFGLPVVLGTTLCAYGYEAVSLDRYLTLDKDDPALIVDRGWLGRGSRYLFLEVHRGDPQGQDRVGVGSWTPSRPYLLDLANGDWTPLQGFGGDLMPWVDGNRQRFLFGLDQVPQVEGMLVTDSSREAAQRIDAATGELQDLDPAFLRREVWHPTRWQGELTPYQQVLGGWLVFRRGEAAGSFTRLLVDEDLEEICEVPRNGWIHALGTACVVHAEYRKRGTNQAGHGPWMVLDGETGRSTPARNPPSGAASLAALDQGVAVLCDPTSGVLEWWDPRTGTRQAMDWDGPASTGLVSFQVLGPAGSDDLVLKLVREIPESQCTVVVDRARRVAHALTGWASYDSGIWNRFVGQDAEGAVWLIEDRRRVVRIGPGLGEREVVFP